MKPVVSARHADYEACRSLIFELKRRYPFILCRVCGRSLAGRPIFTLSIGHGRRGVLFAAGFHGQEWLTSLLLLRFTETVLVTLSKNESLHGVKLREALCERELIFVPLVNPDGVQIALHGCAGAGNYSGAVARISGGDLSCWNANARGVDINHNFNAGRGALLELERAAGITGPSPRRFGGSSAESEPETAALTRLCRSKRPCHAVALHSQGEEIYWRYGGFTPEKSALMAKVFSASSGYALADNEGTSSHGGFKDWFISEFRRPAFTVEVGKGKNPLPVEDFDGIYSKIEELLTLASIM